MRIYSLAAVALAIAAAGCLRDQPAASEVSLVPFASAPVPLSRDNNVALTSAREACVIESYNFRVVCVTPEETIGVFGGRGEGPGEFTRPVWLARVAPDRVGIFDSRQDRLTVFRTDGELVSDLSLPSLFFPRSVGPSSLFGDGLLGMVPGTQPEEGTEPTAAKVLVEVSLRSGEVLWHRSGLEEVARTECGRLGSSRPTPSGGYVLYACKRDMVFLEDRDGMAAAVIHSPNYVAELPNERDMEARREGLASISGGRVSAAAMEPYVAGYREEPKGWFLLDGLNFDDLGRLWVATRRDRDAFSYFDIWMGTEYAGTVRIRDRLIGYDILGSTLVALVERTPDRNGVAQRAIDWYDIDVVEVGLAGSKLHPNWARIPESRASTGFSGRRAIGDTLGVPLFDPEFPGWAGQIVR